MSTLYIHCGVHKTGTSTAQAVMGVQYEALKAAGLLVPKAGRAEQTGHHNIAWEFTRDRRYNPNFGGMEALKPEVAGFAGDVIVSSEDFQGLFMRPEGFAPLLDLARDTGRQVAWIVYVRNQADYLESLFQQCLKEGFGEDYAAFAAEAVETGLIRRWEWTFHFDFARALESLAGLDAGRVVVRNFHTLEGGSTTADLLSVVGVPAGVVPREYLDARLNEREPVWTSLQRFYGNRLSREVGQAETVAMELMGRRIEDASSPAWIEAQMREAFGASNASLCRRFGIPEQGLTAPPGEDRPRDAASLARVFAFETPHAVLRIANALAAEGYRIGGPITPQAERELEAWSAWVAEP